MLIYDHTKETLAIKQFDKKNNELMDFIIKLHPIHKAFLIQINHLPIYFSAKLTIILCGTDDHLSNSPNTTLGFNKPRTRL